MHGDAPYRRLVTALWVLVRTAGTRDATATATAAAAAQTALAAVAAVENHVILQERDGSLLLNGRRLSLGVDGYAAVAAVAQSLAAMGVRELLLTATADLPCLTAFAAWAAGLSAPPASLPVEDFLPSLGITSIAATGRGEQPPPMALPQAAAAAAAPPDSRLRSVFVLHKLIAAFTPNSLADGSTARIVLGAVVDRLLQEPNGTAPLLLLLQDAEALPHAVHSAVVATTVGRALGCSDDLLAELACAALLHDVGRLLGAGHGCAAIDGRHRDAGVEGCHWLLAQGDSDLWQRAALVARTFAEQHGARLEDLGGESSLGAALARLGCRADQLLRQQGRDAGAALEILRLEAAAGVLPMELVEVLAAAGSGCS